MSERQQEREISLTIGDKINWPFILASAVLKFQESIIRAEGLQSEQEVREAALDVYNNIPTSWIENDKKFAEDFKQAVITKEVDSRKVWCGVRIGSIKDHPPEIIEEIDPWRLYRACVDVFERRGLIGKKEWTEFFTGKEWTKEDEDAIQKDTK